MALTTAARTSETDAGRDRQRGRNERGVRSASSANQRADKLPAPPRERRPALAALAVLLIIGGAATAGLLAVRADERVPVLVARAEIDPGTEITRDHLAVASVSADQVELIPSGLVDQLVGRYAVGTIPEGRLLDAHMFTTESLVTSGKAAVGVKLTSGRAPAEGLAAGDLVQVVRVKDGVGDPIVQKATVSRVTDPMQEGGLSTTSSDPVVTLVVNEGNAAEVAAAAAVDQIALVLVGKDG